jgi:hypothetical protein
MYYPLTCLDDRSLTKRLSSNVGDLSTFFLRQKQLILTFCADYATQWATPVSGKRSSLSTYFQLGILTMKRQWNRYRYMQQLSSYSHI